VLTGKALAMQQRIGQLQQEIAQDKASVNHLKAASAAPVSAKNAAAAAATAGNLQVAQTQLGLDSDELKDAQQDLQRETGDLSVRIHEELEAHEASMRQYDSEQKNGGGQIAVISAKSHGTLAGRLSSWFSQGSRKEMIEQAQQQAQSDIGALTAEHNTIEGKANAAADAAKPGQVTLAELQDRSTQREILSIDDDRIQTS